MSDTNRFLLAFVFFVLAIVLPLTGYLKLRGQRDSRIVLSILAIWALWNLVNAPIHEGAHWLAGSAVGLHAKDYRLIQHFWEGDFIHGYISWDNPSPRPLLFSTSGAYLGDGLLVLFGFSLLRWHSYKPFSSALILALTYLRSIFDVAVNYSADTMFGGKGDFRYMLGGYPRLLVHLGAVSLILIGVVLTSHEFLRVHRSQRKVAGLVPPV